MPAKSASYRSVARLVRAVETVEGDGVEIRRAFPTHALMDLDPFLLLDHLGPTPLEPGKARGFPEHPHRGFETVTYMLEGEIEHRDSRGNHGVLGPGDVQWMTAGAGLVHSEMPGPGLLAKGGRLHGFQLWVNLPRRHKMAAPKYQEIPGAHVPVVHDEARGVEVRIIAGEALGGRGVIDTRIPISYLHLTFRPGASHAQPLPRSANAFVYVFRGDAVLGEGPDVAPEGHMAVFLKDGDEVLIANRSSSKKPLDVLFLAGEPIGEPVVRGGPFVMNTKEELYKAFQDYREGRLG